MEEQHETDMAVFKSRDEAEYTQPERARKYNVLPVAWPPA